MCARFDAVASDPVARPLEPAHLHLALLFLGRLARLRLPALQDALCTPFKPFELRLRYCDRWPSGLAVMVVMVHCSVPRLAEGPEPPVDMVLDVDREYRAGVGAGSLPRIAPMRFNPDGEAWLPVLHTERPGWHFTALVSNTARAHELDRSHDWVVVYGENEAHHEHISTVVTASRGVLAGRRVVRGREAACGSNCLNWHMRRRCKTASARAVSLASTWAANPCRTPRSC